MMRKKLLVFTILLFLPLALAGNASADAQKQLLGMFLFMDKNLSDPPGQSCMSCHHPLTAFVDPQNVVDPLNSVVSEGVIPGRFGGRNAPSAAYASFSPSFHFDEGEGLWFGGQFWDGRAATLKEQAKGPFLNEVEMNNTKEGVVRAVRTSIYVGLFLRVFGSGSLADVESAYDKIAEAIAEFEKSKALNQFTSKFDWYLKGKVKLTSKEKRGLDLFNDPAKGNCAACHPTTPDPASGKVLLTDFSYDNLGIPKNLRIPNSLPTDPPDLGLGKTVDDPNENGKFKVSSLRNIAKTPPYGHNGYFTNLKEIVHFYNARDVEPFEPPEYEPTVNHDELGNLGLTSQEEDDIVAFLKTLTDGYVCPKCR